MLAERKKTALYARLSKDDLEDAVSNSIIHQKFMLEKYAEEHGYYNTQFYADDGYTGGTETSAAAHGKGKVIDISRNFRRLCAALYLEN